MIDIDAAAKWAELRARVGFPVVVAFFVLWRVEHTLQQLITAVHELTHELASRWDGAERRRGRREEP